MIRVLLMILISAGQLLAQQVITGKVIDADTGKPIAFVSIGIVGAAAGTSSNQEGEFALQSFPQAQIKFSCIGYQSLTVEAQTIRHTIQLKAEATQLPELVVFDKSVNAQKIVKKAFSSLEDNYATSSFFQRFFYRHYCRDDDKYGRLIEAFTNVWKHNGYRRTRTQAEENEEINVTHLRRSLDRTAAAQGHVPIAIKSILQADVAAYQLSTAPQHLSLFGEVNELRATIHKYKFNMLGITRHDDEEVYIIGYASREDSILTTVGYKKSPGAVGTLFITTTTHAIVKAEEVKFLASDTVRSSAYYRKHQDKYYPYHLIREGKMSSGNSSHWYHVELASVEIKHEPQHQFTAKEPGRDELLRIPYDSAFWHTANVIKATPLEESIIHDLGGGQSLNEQFKMYRDFEANINNGGDRGEQKFYWLRNAIKGKQGMYVAFWSSSDTRHLYELEFMKRHHAAHKDNIRFVLLSLDDDNATWQQTMTRFNLFANGIINYRIGTQSGILREYNVRELPRYLLFSPGGTLIDTQAKRPFDPQLEEQLKMIATTGH